MRGAQYASPTRARPFRSSPTPRPAAVFRARDLSAAAGATARDALAREVEYARTSGKLYAAVLAEAHGAKADIAALGAAAEALAGGAAGARLAAAALAGADEAA